jgi:predicted NAD/FAD-binding protein
VGGGLSGVACAWLLDGVADSFLFESRSSLGGHAHTIPVAVGGETLFVDVGAQFFAPGPHPTYSRLLELIGLTSPGNPAGDATLEAQMSITVTETGETLPRFISPTADRYWTVLAPWNREALFAFSVFALAARAFTESGDWLLPLDTWLERLPVEPELREGLLLPLLSAMAGCSIEQARGLSARSALFFVGRALPENLLSPFLYNHSLYGLQGNLRYLAGICRSLTTHLGSNVTEIQPLSGGGFTIANDAGVVETVDVAIVATPPYVTRSLLPRRLALLEARALMERFGYFQAEISIHRDPVYMPERRLYWSAYNPILAGAFCEASIWYGALRPVPAGQAPLMLFKSWATARDASPRYELFRREFLHPRVTPDFIRAQTRLAPLQGQEGLWFAGSYTLPVDSQESALVSAMNVVRELDPEAPNLVALES